MNASLPAEPAPDLVAELAQDVFNRQCALFVGPDLSISADGFEGLPSSIELAADLATELGEKHNLRLLAYSLPYVADVYQSKTDSKQLLDWLEARIYRRPPHALPVHRLIARLPFRIIVNFGWDRLLASALELEPHRPRPYYIVNNDKATLGRPTADKQLLYFTPYGTVGEPDPVRITRLSQRDMATDQPQMLKAINFDAQGSALLLIGYAPLPDEEFADLFRDIQRTYQPNPGLQPRAVVVCEPGQRAQAAPWEAQGFQLLLAEPSAFLIALVQAVAKLRQAARLQDPAQPGPPEPDLPPLGQLSDAPLLTEVKRVEAIARLRAIIDQLGFTALVERTSVPTLNEEQSRELDLIFSSLGRLNRPLGHSATSAELELLHGNLEYSRENFDQARAHYETALAANPDLAEAYFNLHFVHLAQRHWALALSAYQQAVLKRPALALLPEQYVIDGVLGRGGSGAVYAATVRPSGQRVAIKVLHRAQAETQRVLEKFQRETTLLRQLHHAHTVQLIDSGEYDGNYYIVTTFLEGVSVRDRLAAEQGGAGRPPHTSTDFSLKEALAITLQICEALADAHRLGIVHRDVKPSNIMLTPAGAYLIDFGLARSLAATQPTLSAAGTLTYAAPEQVQGKRASPASDQFGLATVFYEMLGGLHRAEGTYKRLSELRPNINPEFDLIIEKAREQQPEDRYPDIVTFGRALAEAGVADGGLPNAPPWRVALARAAQAARLVLRGGWRPWLTLIVSLALGLGLALIGVKVLSAPEQGLFGLNFMQLTIKTVTGWLCLLVCLAIGDRLLAVVANRLRSGPVANYASLLAIALGLSTSLYAIRQLLFYATVDEGIWLFAIVGVLFGGLTSLFFTLGLSYAGGWLAVRARRPAHLAFFLVVAALMIFIFILPWLPVDLKYKA